MNVILLHATKKYLFSNTALILPVCLDSIFILLKEGISSEGQKVELVNTL